MPQMASISWLFLFFLFSIIFILLPSSPKSNELKNINLNFMNWKW